MRTAERIAKENDPDVMESKAAVKSRIAEHEADEAEHRKREQDANTALETRKSLTPEEHGVLVSGLITQLIKGGVEEQRAYSLALQALSPGAIQPAAQPPSTTENKLVKDFLDLVLAEWKQGRQPATKPETGEGGGTRQPADPLAQLKALRDLGEQYVLQVYGLTAEEIAKLRSSPRGEAVLTSVGGDIETRLKVLEFEDTIRQRWAKHDAELDRYRRETDRQERAAGTLDAAKKEVTGGIGRVMDAAARAMDAVSKRAGRQNIEEKAAATGQNPKCPECSAELAPDGPPGHLTCTGCGRSYPIG